MAAEIDAKMKVEGTDKAVQALEEVGDAAVEASEKVKGTMDEAKDGAKGAGDAAKKSKGGFMTMVGGLKAVKVAIAATGVGLLVQLVIQLIEYIKTLGPVAEKIEQGMGALGAMFGVIGDKISNITDLIGPMGEMINDAFENPVEAIKGLGEAIYNFVMRRIENLMDAFGYMGDAISKLFSGDFKGAMEAGAKASWNLFAATNPLGAVLDDNSEALLEFGEELLNAAGKGIDLVKVSQALEKRQRAMNKAVAEGNIEVSEQRLIAEDTTKAIEDRVAAAERAGEIEQTLNADKVKMVEQQLALARRQQALNGVTKDSLDKISELEIQLMETRQAGVDLARAATAQINGLYDEQKAKVQELQQAEQDRLDGLYERQNALENAIISAQDAEILATMQKYDELFLLAEEFGYGEQELQERMNAEMKAINDKYRAEEDAADKALTDKKIERKHNEIAQGFDIASAGLQLMQALNEGADEEDEKSAKKRFERGKAMQIAGAIMSTAQAVIASLAAPPVGLGVPAGIPGSIAAGVLGAAQIVTISKQKFQPTGDTDTGGGGGSGGGVRRPTTQALIPDNFAPSTTTPNTDDITAEPTRAYVVSGDVTSSQQLDNELAHRATL